MPAAAHVNALKPRGWWVVCASNESVGCHVVNTLLSREILSLYAEGGHGFLRWASLGT